MRSRVHHFLACSHAHLFLARLFLARPRILCHPVRSHALCFFAHSHARLFIARSCVNLLPMRSPPTSSSRALLQQMPNALSFNKLLTCFPLAKAPRILLWQAPSAHSANKRPVGSPSTVPLNIGDQVPADGILISGHSLSVDESSMTGESKNVHKDQKSPFFMSGCKIADGYGVMLVTAVGINTKWGLLMASISEDNGEETPLQVHLNGVATLVGMVGLSIAALVLVVLLVRYFTGHTKNSNGRVQFNKGQTSVKDAIDGAIKILTVAVCLPLAVTLTLAYSMRKMMADKALVRRLSSCETMGSATTICSDKTRTLTLNQMTIVEAHVGGIKLSSPDDGQQLSSTVSSLLIESIAQNTNANVYEPEDGGPVEITGYPTEKGNFLGTSLYHAPGYGINPATGGLPLPPSRQKQLEVSVSTPELHHTCPSALIRAEKSVFPISFLPLPKKSVFRSNGFSVPSRAEHVHYRRLSLLLLQVNHVALILGLPNQGKEFQFNRIYLSNLKHKELVQELADLTVEDSSSTLQSRRINALIRYVLAAFFYPLKGLKVPTCLLDFKGLEDFAAVNWPKAIHTFLHSHFDYMKEIAIGEEMKNLGYLEGCSVILMVWFLEHTSVASTCREMITPRCTDGPPSLPLAYFIVQDSEPSCQCPMLSKTSILQVFPFNSEKKRGGVALHVAGSEVHVHWKGAAEIVLASCSSWMDLNGQVQELTPNQMDYFKKSIGDMAAVSLRCVAIAYRLYEMGNVPKEEERNSWALPDNDLVLLGIVGIKDPCRTGFRDAVDLCTNAGVKVRMITGDNIQTKAIDLECGVLRSEEEAVEPTLIEGKLGARVCRAPTCRGRLPPSTRSGT
ncbi:Calcium-transporting ATPase 9, plasma membrane-type [Platanthera guangdongensis]|uniref:Calcium-transporting ATPase 9, plasma membrane-type n=1 Tax=Platanthera guangdongensis TaxID=2320717 RepID=A0ABR2LCS0_9ASPA